MSGLDNTSFTTRIYAGVLDTLTDTDSVVVYTNTAAKTVNLPPVASVPPGRRFVVINTATGTLTLDGAGSETINGATTLAVTASTGRADVVAVGTAWFTVSAS